MQEAGACKSILMVLLSSVRRHSESTGESQPFPKPRGGSGLRHHSDHCWERSQRCELTLQIVVNIYQSTCQLWKGTEVMSNFISNWGKIGNCSQGETLFVGIQSFAIISLKVNSNITLTSKLLHYSGVTSSCTN